MISTVSTIVPSYRKLKICNFACCLEWKNKNLTKRILFIYLLASSFASWNMACCVSTTASGLSDAGARVVLSVLRSEQKGTREERAIGSSLWRKLPKSWPAASASVSRRDNLQAAFSL